MEINYLSASFIFIAAFVVFAILAFRAARSAKTEGGGEAGRSDARPGSLRSECSGRHQSGCAPPGGMLFGMRIAAGLSPTCVRLVVPRSATGSRLTANPIP